jgi:hypothetical protein
MIGSMINRDGGRGRLAAALQSWTGFATRFRWAFLPATAAGAALLFALGSPYHFTIPQIAIAGALFVILALPLLVGSSWPRPTELIVASQGLATPLDLGFLANAVTSTLLTGIVLSGIDRWTWPWWNIAGAATLFLSIAHRWFRALRWSGIRLEPDGVRYQQIRARLIPWQDAPELVTPARNPDAATAVLHPGNRKIRPTLAPSYLAAAIREYVAHPEHRAALGTTTELARLTAQLSTPQSTANRPSQ